MRLELVTTEEQAQWLRMCRNLPELMKYFHQDVPQSEERQRIWWRNIDKSSIRLFIVYTDNLRVGYVGFNPFIQRAARANFGVFILPEYQGFNYGKEAVQMLLKKGFEEYNLKTIFSDVLDYPGENRFEFYRKLGFEAFPKEHQYLRYKKSNQYIPAVKFFMTKDMYDKDINDRLGTAKAKDSYKQEDQRKGSRIYTGKNWVKAAAK